MTKQNLRQLIAQNDLEKVIKKLLEITQDDDKINNTIIGISRRHRNLKEERQKGTDNQSKLNIVNQRD